MFVLFIYIYFILLIWFLVEFFFLIILIVLMCPFFTKKTKLIWSISLYAVLCGCMFFFTFSGLHFTSILNLTKYLYTDLNFIFFGFPIIFIIDNLTCFFCFLTLLLGIICLLAVKNLPNYQNSSFLVLLWILEFSLFHTFTSLNLIFFYIFFEISLIPMVLFIFIWGSRQRKVHATYVFFFYTVFGSFFLLLGILYLYLLTNTLLVSNLTYINLTFNFQLFLWIFFFIGFAVKVPLVPLHTWLPEAHVEAPTIGSIILAGLLLKIGTFGMIRFMFPFLNFASVTFQPLIFTVSIISIYHASLIALRQFDLKKIIAYSSIAHMGFVILGLFSFNIFSFLGSLFIMFSHGFVASALFFLIGVIYDRYKSKNLFDYSGLVTVMPIFIFFLFFFILANLSFPGTSNFIGEFITLIGITEINIYVSFLLVLSIILTSIYSIWIFNRIAFGVFNLRLHGFSDLNKNEFYICLIFFLFVFFLGINPNLFFFGLDYIPFFYILS